MRVFDVEQLDPARLEKCGDVTRVVVGGKGESVQLWPLPFLERLLELAFFLGGFGRLCLGVLDPFSNLALERSKDLVALSRPLLTLLKVTQPKRSIDADKDEQELSQPATDFGVESLLHRGYRQKDSGRRRTVKSAVGRLARDDGCHCVSFEVAISRAGAR